MDGGDSGVPGSPGNELGRAKADAISSVVKAREETNLRLIGFYQQIYDNIRPKRPGEEQVCPTEQLYTMLERNRLGGLNDSELDAYLRKRLMERIG